MISLRKAMDQQRDELLQSALDCCRGVVASVAENGARVCPPVADTFQQNLINLCEHLSAAAAPGEVSKTEQEIGRELEGWSTRASDYYRRKAGEIRDIMLAMTDAAQAVGDRDELYRAQFGEVSARLQEIGDIEDLARIKHIVTASADNLRSCVDRMVEDGKQSIAGLKTQLAEYEQRLQDAERTSSTDVLTGLLNRVGMEREIANRIGRGGAFCLMVVDLNGFKKVNDTYGHAAGDALLKAFSTEFKAQFRPLDPVGRWGGDEFVVVLDCPVEEARARIDQVRKWALGEYPLPGKGKVTVGAAVGLAEWEPGWTGEKLFSEADRAMYADKRER